MRKKMAIFLMEDGDGPVAVQLYEDPAVLAGLFGNLAGKPGDKPSRATMISLEFEGGQVSVVANSKELPVPMVPEDERPDGLLLGGGPIFLPKEKKEAGDATTSA